MQQLFRITALSLLMFCATNLLAQQNFQLIYNGHSHNDYTRKRPLLDALDNGFMSVEVDVFLRKGDIKVAHTSWGIKKKKNLKNLYLEPLRKRVKENGGSVYAGEDCEFVIMIDLKDNGPEIMQVLNEQLTEYAELFTSYGKGGKKQGPVRIVLSGGPSKDLVTQYDPRLMSMDEHVSGFDRKNNMALSPRVSARYGSIFNWSGNGPMPEEEQKLMKELVVNAHMYGKKVRFWATPANEAVWKAQLDAGVDWINVDDLAHFRKFYLEYLKEKAAKYKP